MKRNLLKVFVCAFALTMGVQVANAQEVYKQNGVTVGTTPVDPLTQKQQEEALKEQERKVKESQEALKEQQKQQKEAEKA
ncbi:MAG: hypothetical protein II431_11660, partial [Prevotella sp.]|nr:hypothetical protein [Prevotella sp.]